MLHDIQPYNKRVCFFQYIPHIPVKKKKSKLCKYSVLRVIVELHYLAPGGILKSSPSLFNNQIRNSFNKGTNQALFYLFIYLIQNSFHITIEIKITKRKVKVYSSQNPSYKKNKNKLRFTAYSANFLMSFLHIFNCPNLNDQDFAYIHIHLRFFILYLLLLLF